MSRTIFLAGGSGFIGAEVCRACVAAGDVVLALCRSQSSARKMETLGAVPVEGDLLEKGTWQEHARDAECVAHLAQPTFFGGRITTKRAEAYREGRARMDANLLGALDPLKIKRVVYVSGTCYYGNLGTALCDETATPRPCSIGRYIVDTVERLDAWTKNGLPIVTAFPGVVYGPGSWFEEYIFAPLARGKRLLAFSGRSPTVSPIHVGDCGRAIAHLLTHGGVGERYFLVDDKPVQWSVLQMLTAGALAVTPRFLTLPRWLVATFMGPIMAEGLIEMDAALSNTKLRALRFEHQYPTVDAGIPAVVVELRNCAPQT